jgi:hypothetical protein
MAKFSIRGQQESGEDPLEFSLVKTPKGDICLSATNKKTGKHASLLTIEAESGLIARSRLARDLLGDNCGIAFSGATGAIRLGGCS